MNLKTAISLLSLIISSVIYAQPRLADPCFSTAPNGANVKSANLITLNGDVLEWNGQSWDGAHKKSKIDKTPSTPPYCLNPVKAVWMGSGTAWNQFGEGVSFKLTEPIRAFERYTFVFVYASSGAGSDGRFAPFVSTSIFGDHIGYPVGRLNAADSAWRTDSISFVASTKQDGDFWITLHTLTEGSSGIVLAQCPQPTFQIQQDKEACNNQEVILSTSFPLPNYSWMDGSSDALTKLTESDTVIVSSQTACGLASDTLVVEFKDCGGGVGLPSGGGSGSGPKINIKFSGISFKLCWFGACDDDDDVPTGPPSPPIRIPNVVTPNNDGHNDFYVLEGAIEGVWKVRVFNRHGMLVFEDLEYKNTWSPEVPPGVYYVVIKDRNSDTKYKMTLTVLY
ncbi:MAG: gliding motility-associated C-terminal domain-containing protein [Bacteroidetes bacterium]|nr:MAG: gliding motility-associated C-terminal domain-containing protein [Bacteroidota bacterium]